jgi:ABC-type antimicrobial peptide transport system permease subunit
MPFFDLLQLAMRNLREAKLRATLTSMGVIVGVAVIVTMVSFGLGLQRNMLSRFRALDLFNEIRVFVADPRFDQTRRLQESSMMRPSPRSRKFRAFHTLSLISVSRLMSDATAKFSRNQ